MAQKVGIVFILLGAGLAALGLTYDGPFMGGAVASFGIAAIVGGVHSVVTRRHLDGRFKEISREHRGTSAVIFGITFVATGLVLVVGGLASVLGFGDELWNEISARPGASMMVVGIWVSVIGMGTAISRWTFVGTSTNWWQRLPGVILGLFLIVLGLGIFWIGRSLAVDPPAPDEILETALDTLERWFGGS